VAWDEHTCWSLTCGICGDGWRGELPHFASREDASAYAAATGWDVTGERMVCPDCAEVTACAAAGHRWGSWTPAGPFPYRTSGGTWQGRVRHCVTCSAADWDPPIGGNRSGDRRGAETSDDHVA